MIKLASETNHLVKILTTLHNFVTKLINNHNNNL